MFGLKNRGRLELKSPREPLGLEPTSRTENREGSRDWGYRWTTPPTPPVPQDDPKHPTLLVVRMVKTPHLHLFPGAATTKHHKLSGFTNKNVLPHSPGG